MVSPNALLVPAISRLLRVATCSASLLLVASATPSSAQPQSPVSQAFSDVVDVRVVNIEVVVVDKQGQRVGGLGVEDFELKVDGVVVPIDYFSEISGGAAVAADDTRVASVPQLRPGARVGTNYLLFIDDYFAIARDRDRVLDNLEEQLSDLPDGDRLAVVAFDGKELSILSSWTDSPRDLERAFRTAKQRKTYGLQRASELRVNDEQRRERAKLGATMNEMAQGDLPDPRFLTGNLNSIEREYANRLTDHIKRSVMAAVYALRSFANPEGRKVMLVLSGGWPFSPAEFTVDDYGSSVEEIFTRGAFDTSIPGRNALFQPLSDTANLLSYTLYPVDVPGFRRETSTDAQLRGTETALTSDNPNAPSTGPPRELLVHAGLDFLAEETGGLALINAQRDHALDRVIEDTRSYYWLGFQPKRLDENVRHDIEVTLKGHPGLEVRARTGYVDRSRQSEMTMLVESSLLIGDPPSTKPLVLDFGRPEKTRRNRRRIHLEVGVPLDDVVLIPSNGRYVNELEIQISVQDLNGNRSETSIDKIPISGTQPPRPGQLMYYETDLLLAAKDHRIVVAVFDPLSGTILSSSTELSTE